MQITYGIHPIAPDQFRTSRRSWKTTMAASLAVLVLGPGVSHAADQASLTVRLPSAPASKVPGVPENYRLDGGDHLQIRFYDRFDREDLNGEYVVNEAGELRLPRFGKFEARGKSTTELEQDIRQIIEKKGEKPGYFSIEVTECRPFYVSGLANRPGGYPYVPGFTVMHAVSLAGGLYRSPMASVADVMRERRGLTETLDRLASFIARRARLMAERENAATIPVPKELTRLVSGRANEMIESETIVLQHNREIENRDRTWLQDTIAVSKKEAEDYRTYIERVTRRVDEQMTIVDGLKKLQDQKIVNQQRVLESVVALDNVQRDKEIAMAGLSRANNTMQKADRDLAMLVLEKNARIAREMTEADQEISRLRVSATETRKLASGLETLATQGGVAEVASYRIMRRNEAGQLAFVAAKETTPIMPGDVIQIDSIQNDSGSLF